MSGERDDGGGQKQGKESKGRRKQRTRERGRVPNYQLEGSSLHHARDEEFIADRRDYWTI